MDYKSDPNNIGKWEKFFRWVNGEDSLDSVWEKEMKIKTYYQILAYLHNHSFFMQHEEDAFYVLMIVLAIDAQKCSRNK